jgi:putative glutamine amidotransferase
VRSEVGAGPVIGIAAARERARWSFWDQPAQVVAESYVGAVERTGAASLLLPIVERPHPDLLDRIDALLLIGGADVDPASYGADRDPTTEATSPERDRFEITLVRAALDRGLPLLGICRGMQVLNVAHGGTLRQEVAPDGSNPHRRALGTFEGSEHKVTVEPGSLAAAAIGEEVHTVRCHHHQGVAKIGEGLAVSARAAVDGLVEAIEADNGSWVLGVQWHPEADERTRLFEALTEAAGGPARRGRKPGAGRDAPFPARERA